MEADFMLNLPMIRQDFKINRVRILILFVLQMVSILTAIGICEMKLIEISDIFWDTIPVMIIPMVLEMLLAYETITRCGEDGTMDLILATGIRPQKILFSKIFFIMASGVVFLGAVTLLGCLTRVYSLTGEWDQNRYLCLNAGAVCLQIFLGGFSYWMACRSGSLKRYLLTGVLIPILLYTVYVVYYRVPQLFFLQYITVFSLFRQSWFAKGSVMAWIGSGILLIAGIFCFLLGNRAFYDHNFPE